MISTIHGRYKNATPGHDRVIQNAPLIDHMRVSDVTPFFH